MLKGNRFLLIVSFAVLLSIALAGVLNALLLAQAINHPPRVRSGLATATLVRAERLWRSGQQVGAVQQFAQGYFMVAESTIRFPLARYYAQRSTEYLDQGSYREALDWCLRAAYAIGRYDMETGTSYACPGIATKVRLYQWSAAEMVR